MALVRSLAGSLAKSLASPLTGPADGGVTPPLDSVTAVRAYSVSRQLRTAYAGSAIRVRRSSDDAEQDIGFSGGVLDTASLLSFVGAGDGFITTVYDQSGNAENSTQSTAAGQPQIVASGVLNEQASKAGMEMRVGAASWMQFATPGAQPLTFLAAAYWNGTASGNRYMHDGDLVSARLALYFTSGRTFIASAGTNLTSSAISTDAQMIVTAVEYNSTSSAIRLNGSADAAGDAGTQTAATNCRWGHAYVNNSIFNWLGLQHELIVLSGTSDRAVVESNMVAEYL